MRLFTRRAPLAGYRGNRLGIGLVGLVLMAGGWSVLAVRADHAGTALGDLGVFAPRPWAWSPAAVIALPVALMVALAASRWLIVALGWGRCGSRTGPGIAMLGVALKAIEGVGPIRVMVVGERRLRASVSVSPEADLLEVVDRLSSSAVARVRRVLGWPDLPAVVRVHVRRR